MYFYEVISSCDRDILTEEFLKLCKNSPNIDQTREAFLSALKEMENIQPNINDTTVIHIERCTGIDNVPFEAVSAIFENDPEKYGLEINPWADTLGYRVDEITLEKYSYKAIASLVIWEMTWFGYNEETIRQRVSEWDEESEE